MKVTKEAKKALKESIEVWEDDHMELVLHYGEWCELEIWSGVVINFREDSSIRHNGDNCPLCSERIKLQESCTECCPIAIKAGRNNCFDTPFWYIHDNNDTNIVTEHLIQDHLAMITFMKNLYKECEV